MTSSNLSNETVSGVEPEKHQQTDPKTRLTLLSSEDDLQLQQLLQTRFWQDKAAWAKEGSARKADTEDRETQEIPDRWQLTQGLTLHEWQRRCIDGWFANGKRGVIKVVTGAGKTVLALAIAERLQQIDDKRHLIRVRSLLLLFGDALSVHGLYRRERCF